LLLVTDIEAELALPKMLTGRAFRGRRDGILTSSPRLARKQSYSAYPYMTHASSGLRLMNWQLLLSVIFALVYLAWIWRSRKVYSRIGFTLCLIGSAGILIMLTCECIKTLPSHAPLRTITGLAWGKSSDFFTRSHSDFILTETGTDQRFLFTTVIDGPWADQPVRATYVEDGRKIPRVVRIEILSGDQFPWHVQKGHAGWVGTTEAKRSTPLMLNFIGFVFIMAGVFAPASKTEDSNTQDEKATVPGE